MTDNKITVSGAFANECCLPGPSHTKHCNQDVAGARSHVEQILVSAKPLQIFRNVGTHAGGLEVGRAL